MLLLKPQGAKVAEGEERRPLKMPHRQAEIIVEWVGYQRPSELQPGCHHPRDSVGQGTQDHILLLWGQPPRVNSN